MKLPNFINFTEFNSLKIRMGIDANHLASFSTVVSPARLNEEEIDKLTSGVGLDVAFDEIAILGDGTLAYKGRRVLLYIRDVAHYGQRDGLPKYHLANCTALQTAQHAGRFGRRYVVANQTDGIFQIKKISGTHVSESREHLNVCQYCLSLLKLGGFSYRLPHAERYRRVRDFRPQIFFDLYPIDIYSQLPQFDSTEAPTNVYPDGFREISAEFKAATNWTCQGCGEDFSAPSHRKFLDTHHKNGDKSDSSVANLKAVCIACHANEPAHGHLKKTPRYREFLSLKRK